jgi:sulfotransferase famil protein
MSKPSWKYKRLVNQAIFSVRKYHTLVKFLVFTLYILRLLARNGKKPAKDIKNEKALSPKHGFIYIGNPKVATRSVLQLLNEKCKDDLVIHHDTMSSLYKIDASYENLYQFTLVRNPWARAYSCWKDKISTEKKFSDAFILSKYKGLYPDMSFSEFVYWLNSEPGSDEYADRHWLSKTELLANKREKPIDLIGKIEEIEAFQQKLLEDTGLQYGSLKRLNNTSEGFYGYRKYYTDELRNLIAQRYKADIEAFNYQF